MSVRVGICPVCKTKQRVHRAWHSTEHEPAGTVVVLRHADPRWANTENSLRGCGGTGRKPLPTKEQLQRSSRRRDLIEPFRAHAAVALDAWIEQRAYPDEDMDVLLRVALYEYEVFYPNAGHVASVRYVSRVNRDLRRNGAVGDIYCTFCGVLLYSRASGLRYGMSADARTRLGRNDRHAVECTLKHLAFGLVPVAPDVRKLPDEYQQEATP